MAPTAYQTQFKRRMKRAIKLRAKADQKARGYTQLLADAIGAAEDAATQMNELNQDLQRGCEHLHAAHAGAAHQ